ncbi:hypothetical protein ACFV2H_32870 [Streptomyces sp. NPDC059629]|uniref:hypothetical protein n=1 Tax=Streptomyces sp. NPDC059629 TaxID=3346889 RepID=UPI0036CC7F26
MLADSSCYHAALATLLLQRYPGTDPALLLGCRAGTRAVVQDGELVFGEMWPALINTLRIAGHEVGHTAAETGGGLTGLTEALARHGSAVAVVDTYHLDHFWMARRQVHALHSVVLCSYDESDQSVRMLDPGDVVTFDGRVPLTALEGALTRDRLNQSWLVMEDWADSLAPGLRPTPWAVHRSALVGSGHQMLSGTQLTEALLDRLPALFGGGAGADRPGGAPVPDVPALQHGLWSYHHTLRWFARHVRARAAITDGPAPGESVIAATERAAQDLLVLRSLLRHAGPGDPERLAHYRSEAARRLHRIQQSLIQVAAELAVPGPGAGTREPSDV